MSQDLFFGACRECQGYCPLLGRTVTEHHRTLCRTGSERLRQAMAAPKAVAVPLAPQKASAPAQGKCHSQRGKRHAMRTRAARRRTFCGSLTPSCGFLGKSLGEHKCKCTAKNGVEAFECRLHVLPGSRLLPSRFKKCVQRKAEWLSLIDDDIKGAYLCCETCPHKSPPRWISQEQLRLDTLRLIGQLPAGITAVAGHARSGLLPATQVAMALHVPMFVIRSSPPHRDVVPVGNGWRLDAGAPRHNGTLLIVDDNCMTGNSLTRLRPVAHQWARERGFEKTVEAVIYANPLAQFLPEMYVEPVAWPCYYEWNFFNSTFSGGMALDFDGILCEDCPIEMDDDGPRYLEFLRTAKPLYLPKREPIPLIVTARLEKYRVETMAWLARHGLRVKQLVMLDVPDQSRRTWETIIAHKSSHFSHWRRRRKPNLRIGPPMFVESDDRQAQAIAERSGGLVICPAASKVYQGRP